MSTSEVEDLRKMIGELDRKVDDRFGALNLKLDNMMAPLRKIQKHYRVDNPVGRWRGLGRAILSMFQPPQTTAKEDANAK